jgi:hypothetical protein
VDTKKGFAAQPHDETGDGDLPYEVLLWDDGRRTVEDQLARSANPGVAYAAFYAATRLFPDRYITLKMNGRILSRFNGSC